jgi:hypothetical protein
MGKGTLLIRFYLCNSIVLERFHLHVGLLLHLNCLQKIQIRLEIREMKECIIQMERNTSA